MIWLLGILYLFIVLARLGLLRMACFDCLNVVFISPGVFFDQSGDIADRNLHFLFYAISCFKFILYSFARDSCHLSVGFFRGQFIWFMLSCFEFIWSIFFMFVLCFLSDDYIVWLFIFMLIFSWWLYIRSRKFFVFWSFLRFGLLGKVCILHPESTLFFRYLSLSRFPSCSVVETVVHRSWDGQCPVIHCLISGAVMWFRFSRMTLHGSVIHR